MAVNKAKQRMLEGKPAIGAEVGGPRYIIDLEKSPTPASAETMPVVKVLQPLDEAKQTDRRK